jgi:hypothetical protein
MRQLFNSIFWTDLRLHAPIDSGGGSDSASDDGKETFELLNEEETPEEILELPKSAPKDGPDDEDEDEDPEAEAEVDELKEIEEELEGPKDEDLELTTPVRRKEILAKYPKLFKDFPYLEKAYYREQQFTETFPTVQDAKVASNKARILDQVDQQIMNGDISTVLQAAKQEDQEAFYKIADNYLPTLRRVDQQAYYHVVGNLLKDTIISMVRESRALGDQGAPLQAAANILNQYVFGSQNFTPPTTLSRQPNPGEQQRAQQIQYEDQQRFMGQFESVKDDLQTRADNVLKSTITQHIDPKESMTDYVRTHATAEAFQTLENLISKDRQFRGLLDRLWEKAFQTGFDKTSTDRIKSAYLSKAKTLLPSVIKKARNDALKGLGRRSAEQDDEAIEIQPATKRGPVTPGKSTPPSGGKIRSAKDIPRGMSTLDVLMKD